MSSSRYNSYSSSRYSGRDYGSSSSNYSSRNRDRDKDRTKDYALSHYATNPKYTSYTTKYVPDAVTTKPKMEDHTTAPIAKDEIEELSYDAKTPTTPTKELVDAPQEVLQESQISDFVEEDDDKPTEIEEVKLTLSSVIDEKEDEEEQFSEDEEVRKAQELLAASTQIRSPIASPVISPVASPIASPTRVTFAADTYAQEHKNEAENRTPSPTVLNAKKLGGIPWPPKTSDIKKEGGETDGLPKKRVSDLIARFNIGIVDESKKQDSTYKTEYGAGTNVGKVQTHNFA